MSLESCDSIRSYYALACCISVSTRVNSASILPKRVPSTILVGRISKDKNVGGRLGKYGKEHQESSMKAPVIEPYLSQVQELPKREAVLSKFITYRKMITMS